MATGLLSHARSTHPPASATWADLTFAASGVPVSFRHLAGLTKAIRELLQKLGRCLAMRGLQLPYPSGMNSRPHPAASEGAIAAAGSHSSPAVHPDLVPDVQRRRELPASVPSTAPALPAPAPTHTPTILLVDDDTPLLQALADTFRLNGFDVIPCESPEAAEAAFRQAPHIDLLVTDLQMPGISGAVLAKHLLALQPTLPVMIISGASLNREERRAADEGGWCSLNKPFEVMQLLTVIYGMLTTSRDKQTAALLPIACLPELAAHAEPPPADAAQGSPQLTPSKYAARQTGVRRVLLVGNDEILQRSRQLLLENAGFEATAVSGNDALDALDALNLESFQVALICRSIIARDAVQIAKVLHTRNPKMSILRFASFAEPFSGQFDTALRTVSSPRFLIAEVERLASHPHADTPDQAS